MMILCSKRVRPTLFALCLTTAVSNADEPLAVTITYSPEAETFEPGNVTRITRDEVLRLNGASPADVLRQVPGLHIDQPGGAGAVSSLYLRGGDPNFTVVLIDGIKVNDPSNNRGGSFDFSTLSASEIEQVEVVRGAYSNLYGSDALNGVVRITTQPSTPGARIQLAGGTHGFGRVAGSAAGRSGEFAYGVRFALDDDGEAVEGSGARQQLFSTYADISGTRIHLRYSDSDLQSFPDDSGGPQFAVIRDSETRDVQDLAIGLRHQWDLSQDWTLHANYAGSRHDESIDSPGIAPGLRLSSGIPPNFTDTRFDRDTLQLHSRFNPTALANLTFGVEGIREQGASSGALDLNGTMVATDFRLRRDTLAAFVEAVYRLSQDLTAQGSIRYDNADGYAARWSPRVAVRFALPDQLSWLSAGAGKGFKLPSFFALGNPLVGNPDLRPETSTSVDLTFGRKLGWHDSAVSATVFSNRTEDQIDFQETPFPQLVNRSLVDTRGFELTWRAVVNKTLSLDAQLTYVDAEIHDTDEVLRSRPKWRGGLALDWRPRKDVNTIIRATYVGAVPDSSVPTGDRELAPYTRVDAVVAWDIERRIRLLASIDNLFDANYEEAVGFPGMPRRVRLAIRAQY